jgi:tetratricopeptide (TPR) repeat protein
LQASEREALSARWDQAMGQYVAFLDQQSNQKAELAATLTRLELPNLFALLERVQQAGDAAATIHLVNRLFHLLQNAGRPRLLARVTQARDAAAAVLGEQWNHASFQAQRTRIEQQLANGELRQALAGAQALLQRAQAAGKGAYPLADYDLAMSHFTLARVLWTAGGAQKALPLLEEAQLGFEAIVEERGDKGAEGMVSVCFSVRGECLSRLGRYDESAAAYEESILLSEQCDSERDVAVGKGNLGTVRLSQRRYSEALEAFREARERFTRLNEPGSVAGFWHQSGRVYQEIGEMKEAEDAYRQSLAVFAQLGDLAGQAHTLGQLGNLYDDLLDCPEESVALNRQAADKYIQIGDKAGVGRSRYNLGRTLHRLRRYDEARREIRRAIECNASFGHASKPWAAWAILADIETDAGNPATAAEARQQAIATYLAYRRDGGENHDTAGRVALAVTQSLLAGETSAADELLQQYAADPDLPHDASVFIQALQAIVGGSRDRRLAEDPELDYGMAAEILLLIETLEQAEQGDHPSP